MLRPIHYLPLVVDPSNQLIGIVSASTAVMTPYLYDHNELHESQVHLVFTFSSIKGERFKEIILLHDWRKIPDYKKLQDYIENELHFVRQKQD